MTLRDTAVKVAPFENAWPRSIRINDQCPYGLRRTTAGSGRVIGFWALIPPFVYPFSAVALTGGVSFVIDGHQLRGQMASVQEFGCDIMKQTAIVLATTLKETREILGYERALRTG